MKNTSISDTKIIEADFCGRRSEAIVNFYKGKNQKLRSLMNIGEDSRGLISKLNECVKLDRVVCVGTFDENVIASKPKCVKAISANVLNFDLKQTFDLVTCDFDYINSIDEFDDWKKIFKNAYNHTKVGGYFIFDLNTVHQFKKKYSCSHVSYDNFDMVKVSFGFKNKMQSNYIYFEKLGNGNYLKREEAMSEYTYSNSSVIKALKKVGFKKVSLCDHNLKKTCGCGQDKLLVVCEK